MGSQEREWGPVESAFIGNQAQEDFIAVYDDH